MNKFISGVAAAALLSFSSLAGIASAAAAGPIHPGYQEQDRYIGNYCDQNQYAPQCRDWRANHAIWGNHEYQDFYRTHRADTRFGGSVAVGLFGLDVGVGNLGRTGVHVRACEARYHSYNRRTDRFLGYDGSFHVC